MCDISIKKLSFERLVTQYFHKAILINEILVIVLAIAQRDSEMA